MAEKTDIAWCDATFNGWIGCQHVSPGCDHCYAESWSDRYRFTEWGPHGERCRTSADTWVKPRKWNAAAEAFYRAHGHRRRVFSGSLCDWLDNQVPREWRADLLALIRRDGRARLAAPDQAARERRKACSQGMVGPAQCVVRRHR